MADRPLICCGESVRGILEGRKTQTRRVIKPQPRKGYGARGFTDNPLRNPSEYLFVNGYACHFIKCPYAVGDRLWVRETFLQEGSSTQLPSGDWQHMWHKKIEYVADGATPRTLDPESYYPHQMVKRPSIFMPKWAARLWLEVTGIRVERVQEISWRDIACEGIREKHAVDTHETFVKLWDSLNAKPKPIMKNGRLAKLLLDTETLNRLFGNIACYVSYPWEAGQEIREYKGKKWFVFGNPWVRAIEFKRSD